MAQKPGITILASNGSSDTYTTQGTIIQVMLEGSFGGGSVAVELKSPRGEWVPLCDDANTPIALTVEQVKNIEVPGQTDVRCTLSGATLPNLLAKIGEISDGRVQY